MPGPGVVVVVCLVRGGVSGPGGGVPGPGGCVWSGGSGHGGVCLSALWDTTTTPL